MRPTVWNDKFKDETSTQALKFLRALEIAAHDALSLTDDTTKPYAERLEASLNTLRLAFEGGLIDLNRKSNAILTLARINGNEGLCIVRLIDTELYKDALSKLRSMRSVVFGALEDMSLLYSLRLLPIEERIRIKEQLSDLGLDPVSNRLTLAEEKLAEKDPKGSIGECREAYASTIHELAKIKLGKTAMAVEADLTGLDKSGFISREDKGLFIALYSFLSTKWKAMEDPQHGDAELALKQAYIYIGRLLDALERSNSKGEVAQ